MNEIGTSVARTVVLTLSYALVYFALGLLHVFLGGREILSRWNLSVTGMIAFYLFAAASAGVLIGLLLPLARYRSGAALVGFVALLPLSYLMFTVMLPEGEHASAAPWLALGFSAIYGVLGGLYSETDLLGVRAGVRNRRARVAASSTMGLPWVSL